VNDAAILSTIVLIVYILILVAGVGAWASKRTKGLTDFTTGGGIYGGVLLGLVVWATKVSASAFIGGPALFYAFGFSAFSYAGWLMLSAIAVTIVIFMPLRKMAVRLNAQTPMEVVGKRFESKPVYVAYSIIVFAAITLMLVAQFKACGILMQQIIGAPLWVGIVIGSLVMLIYSIAGGRHADILTDGIQGIVMLLMIIMVTSAVFNMTGGIGKIYSVLSEQNPKLVALTSSQFTLAVQIAMPLYWFFAFITQPYSMHLALSARSQKDVRRILIFEYLGYLATIVWVVAVGLGGAILLPGLKPDTVAVTMITKLFPPLLSALFLAGLWSAVMSTTDGALLTGASAISNDLYKGVIVPAKGIDPNSEQVARTCVAMTRLVMVFMVTVAVIITLVRMPPFLALMQYIAFALIGSASTGLIVGTLWWKRATSAGAFASMVAGLLTFIIVSRMISDPGGFISGTVGALASLISLFAVSYFTAASTPENINKAFGEV